jgi:hypothetical protein
MRLLDRLRRLSAIDSPEQIAAVHAQMQSDITAFSATLSGNRILLEAWRTTAQTGGEPALETAIEAEPPTREPVRVPSVATFVS